MPVTDKGIHNIACEQKHGDGELIFEEGNSDDRVCVAFFWICGSFGTIGDMKSILEILQPGEIFGEFALMGAVERTATVGTIGETTIGIKECDQDFLPTSLYSAGNSTFDTRYTPFS
jgi:hypothetical protein